MFLTRDLKVPLLSSQRVSYTGLVDTYVTPLSREVISVVDSQPSNVMIIFGANVFPTTVCHERLSHDLFKQSSRPFITVPPCTLNLSTSSTCVCVS